MIIPDNTTASPPSDEISIVIVRDNATSKLFYLVTIPLKGGNSKELWVAFHEPASRIASEIRQFTTAISAERSTAKAQIDKLLKLIPAGELVGVTEPGWHDDDSAFVTPQWRRGPSADRLRYRASKGEQDPSAGGSFKRFRRDVVAPCMQSSYASFALMLALAAPMLKFAGLSEGAVFHLYGDTTTGKTTAAMVGESVSRSPAFLPGWGQTPRRIEELASGRRDQLLTFNAAEKARPRELMNILHALTHGVAEGSGQGRSSAVADWLPDLTSRSPVLTTGNQSGAAMARLSGLEWDRQEDARFISIPVPPVLEGGIIDRPQGSLSRDETRQLIESISVAARANFGKALIRWVSRVRRKRDRIPGLIDRFVRKAGVSDPYQVRIARKFGLVFAAGTIASEKGWMPWPPGFVFEVVNYVLQHALKTIGEEITPPKVVRALTEAVADRRKIPTLAKGRMLRIKEGRNFYGFRYRKGGLTFVALRRDTLPELVGMSETSDRLAHLLAKSGALEKGHGGKLTQQVPFTIVSLEGADRKSVRMLVLRADRLQSKVT